MTTPTSGTISATDIINEFGNSNSNGGMSLGAYRFQSNQNIGSLSFSTLDNGVPTGSSQISYSQMRNKKLSFVVDYHSFSADRDTSTTHIDAQVRWQQGNTTQVGNFKGTPAAGDWNGGKRVYINYNSTFGGVTNNTQSVVALRTGQFWPDNTEMFIEVGGSGKIFGAGGRGGHGSGANAGGNPGLNGNSALGIDITTTSGNKSCAINVRPGGYIQCGFEGGGGGGGSYDNPSKSQTDPTLSGGGGGGGAGRPAGLGGNAGTGAQKGSNGAAGGAGGANNTTRGPGGAGGDPNEGGSEGGDGGRGAQPGADGGAEAGEDGSGGSLGNQSGGATGSRGAAIRKRDASCVYTLNIDSGGQVIGDGNPVNSAPTGVN